MASSSSARGAGEGPPKYVHRRPRAMAELVISNSSLGGTAGGGGGDSAVAGSASSNSSQSVSGASMAKSPSVGIGNHSPQVLASSEGAPGGTSSGLFSQQLVHHESSVTSPNTSSVTTASEVELDSPSYAQQSDGGDGGKKKKKPSWKARFFKSKSMRNVSEDMVVEEKGEESRKPFWKRVFKTENNYVKEALVAKSPVFVIPSPQHSTGDSMGNEPEEDVDQDDEDGYQSAPEAQCPRHATINRDERSVLLRAATDDEPKADVEDNFAEEKSSDGLPSDVEEEIMRISIQRQTVDHMSTSTLHSNSKLTTSSAAKSRHGVAHLKVSADTLNSFSPARSLSKSWHSVLDKDAASLGEMKKSLAVEDYYSTEESSESRGKSPVTLIIEKEKHSGTTKSIAVSYTGLHSVFLKTTRAYPTQCLVTELFSQSREFIQDENGDLERLKLLHRYLRKSKLNGITCECNVGEGESQSRCLILLNKKLTSQGLSQQLLHMMSSLSKEIQSWVLRCALLSEKLSAEKTLCIFHVVKESCARNSIIERVAAAAISAGISTPIQQPIVPELFPLCLSVIIEEGKQVPSEVFDVFFEEFLGLEPPEFAEESKSFSSIPKSSNITALSCTMSQKFEKPELFPVIVNLLGSASDETLKTVTSALFLLLSSNRLNLEWVISQPDWMDWIVPLLLPPHRQRQYLNMSLRSKPDLADVIEEEDFNQTRKKTEEERKMDPVLSELNRFAFQIQVNLLSLVVHHLMKVEEVEIKEIFKSLSRKLEEVRGTGWLDIMRLLYFSVLRRMCKMEKSIEIHSLDDCIIRNEFELLRLVRKFMFLPFFTSVIDTPLYVSEECEIPDLILVSESLSLLKLRLSTRFYKTVESMQLRHDPVSKKKIDYYTDMATENLIFFQRVQRYIEVLTEEQALPSVEFESLSKSIALEVAVQLLMKEVKKSSIFRTKSAKVTSYKKSLVTFRDQFKLYRDVYRRKMRESRRALEEYSELIRDCRSRTMFSEIAHQMVVSRTAVASEDNNSLILNSRIAQESNSSKLKTKHQPRPKKLLRKSISG